MAEQANPYTADKDQIAFPRLSDQQLERVVPHGACRRCSDGQTLFEAGEQQFPFYVVLEGAVRIEERQDDDQDGRDERVLTVAEHGPGQFTGDVDMITGRPTIVTARCVGDTKVIEVPAEALRKLVAEEASLGEVILRAFLMRRQMITEKGFTGVRLIGSRWSRQTHELKDFLARNQVVFTWLDPEQDADVERLLQQFHVSPADMPVMLCPDGSLLRNPEHKQAADCLGLRPKVKQKVYDLVVVGAGPAGLAAGVYGASEGLDTLVLDAKAPGGQAGTSSRIENYLGFPTGVSGEDLARRATIQAQKFGATLISPQKAVGLACDASGHRRVLLDDDKPAFCRALVIATGAEYRKIDAEGLEKFEGSGIYYGATYTEASLCRDQQVVVVGGGNSAGQAAVYLAEYAKRVTVMIRGDDLSKSMSRYLLSRITQTQNIDVATGERITAFYGGERLERVTICPSSSGDDGGRELEVGAVFVMIGANPRTDWLGDCIGLDGRGFILTGELAKRHENFQDVWDAKRDPFLLETTRPGVFAVGDVRSGSVKRVASAVGEGSMAVKYVHEAMARL
jgi:thioredoxin reductase (NADPH)